MKQLEGFQLGGGLRGENARTVAIVLNFVTPEIASDAMQYLPEEIRGDVFLAMRATTRMPEPLVDKLVRTIVDKSLQNIHARRHGPR